MGIRIKGGFNYQGKLKFRYFSGIVEPAYIEIEREVSSNELNIGESIFSFNVSRTGNMRLPILINYVVTGTGENPALPNDFVNGVYPSGSIHLAPGQASTNILISVQGDEVVEADEQFKVTLFSDDDNINFINDVSIGTIINDDEPGNIKFVTPIGNLGEYDMETEIYTKIEVSGGFNDEYRFQIESGSLPPGLELNNLSGEISGTLSSVEDDTIYSFVLKVSDALNNQAVGEFSIKVKDTRSEIVWITPEGTLVDAPGGYSFSRYLEAKVE